MFHICFLSNCGVSVPSHLRPLFSSLCGAALESNKKLSAHVFEVGSWITLDSSLHRLCVLLWKNIFETLSVCGVVFIFAFFLYNSGYCLGQRYVISAPGFHQALFSVFLAGHSSLSVSSPLNYYVCAHSSVTLNSGFNLLSDRWHRRHVCWSDIWRPLILRLGRIITVIKSNKKCIYLCTFFATTIYFPRW